MAGGKPSVAVIMPAANSAATIGDALVSVLSQSLPPIEIVVVDDGSTDETAACVREFMVRAPCIQLVRQSQHGPSHARNVAIAQSSAQFIAPLDADDVWHPDYLAECVTALVQNPAAGMVYAWHHLIDRRGVVTRGPMRFDQAGGCFGPMLLTNVVGNGSCAVFRRHAIEAAGGYVAPLADWHGGEDYLLQLRIAAHLEVACVKRDLVGYRKFAGTLSTDNRHGYGARCAAVGSALAQYGPAPLPVERWARGDACRTFAVQLMTSRAWGSAAVMGCRALIFDPPAMLWDIALRFRNLVLRRLKRKRGNDRPLDLLLRFRLRLLAEQMPFASGGVLGSNEASESLSSSLHNVPSRSAGPSLPPSERLRHVVAHPIGAPEQ
jgi:hypothetical protein